MSGAPVSGEGGPFHWCPSRLPVPFSCYTYTVSSNYKKKEAIPHKNVCL